MARINYDRITRRNAGRLSVRESEAERRQIRAETKQNYAAENTYRKIRGQWMLSSRKKYQIGEMTIGVRHSGKVAHLKITGIFAHVKNKGLWLYKFQEIKQEKHIVQFQ